MILTLLNDDQIETLSEIITEYFNNLKTELYKNKKDGYCYTYLHIDFDFINNVVDTVIKRSKIDAQ